MANSVIPVRLGKGRINMRNRTCLSLVLALSVVLAAGCEDDDISVLGTTQGRGDVPTVGITPVGPTLGDATLIVTLTGTASSADGITSTVWSVSPSAGVSFTSTTALNTTATFTNPGTYTVTLTATSGSGKTSTWSIPVLVGTAGSPFVEITGVDVTGTTGVANSTFSATGTTGVTVSPASGTTWTLQYVRQGASPFPAPVTQSETLTATGSASTDTIQVDVTYQ